MAAGQTDVDNLFAEAFACFEQGLCYDEIFDGESAVGMYERGLNLVKEAEKRKTAMKSDLYKDIVEARKKVNSRVKALRNQRKSKKETTLPQKESKGKTCEYEQNEHKAKNELRQQLETAGASDPELIFYIPDGVQLFMIEGEEATVPTCPSPLEIFRFNPQSKPPNLQADAFVQVGPWAYPLIPDQTPVLKNEFGAYVVPNPTPEHPNMVVGVLLPSDLDKQVEEDFCSVIKQYTELRTQDISRSLSQEEKTRLSEKIAELLVKGGEKIAWGVNCTAEKTSMVVTERSSKFRSSISPCEEPVNINPAIRRSIHYIHRGSKVVAKCTRYLLDKIGDVGIAVGRQVAAGAERTFGGSRSGGLVSGTITVIGGGITSASTVWMALENASKTLCKNIANETVDTVKLKYGDDASITAHEALYATGHTTLAAFQLWDLGPRSIAGRAARKAGIQFVNDLHSLHSNSRKKQDE